MTFPRITQILLMTIVLAASAVARANTGCLVTFHQFSSPAPFEVRNGWATVYLQPGPFEIRVSPKECSPVIATLTGEMVSDERVFSEVSKLPPVVFAAGEFNYDAVSDDADVLSWLSLSGVQTSLNEALRDKQSLDAYKAASSKLGYEPPIVKPYGAGFVFKEQGDDAVASFQRLTQLQPLLFGMREQSIAAVIYLRHKAESTANFQPQLITPYKVWFAFSSMHQKSYMDCFERF